MNKEGYKVKLLADVRKYRIEHKAQGCNYRRKYYKKNRAKFIEYRRKYYAKAAEARKKVASDLRRREMESKLKAWRTGRLTCPHPKAINLYIFIRLILGSDISNRQIAHRWKMDEKNLHEFMDGRYPVPSLKRLEQLARVLGVNKHLVFEVAGGASAKKVFNLIRKKDLSGQVKLLLPELPKNNKHSLTF